MDFIVTGIQQGLGLLASGDPETCSAIWTTVRVSSLSIGASMLLGAPLGFLLGYTRFRGRGVLKTIVETLLSLPTVVIGLLVYAFLTRNGPLGHWGLLFTVPGIALGQTVLGLPIVIALTASAVENLDARLRDTLMTLGAGRARILASTLWEARWPIMLAGAAAYGRIVSEVGISMMLGGNIKWHTRTVTTAIALETGKGEFAMGMALGLVLMVVALAVNLAIALLRRWEGK